MLLKLSLRIHISPFCHPRGSLSPKIFFSCSRKFFLAPKAKASLRQRTFRQPFVAPCEHVLVHVRYVFPYLVGWSEGSTCAGTCAGTCAVRVPIFGRMVRSLLWTSNIKVHHGYKVDESCSLVGR